jgi:hypothetical protein
MSWIPIVWSAANFKVATLMDAGATWEVPSWGNHFYAYKLLEADTLMLAWRLEATRVTGNPSELRIDLPSGYETDIIGGQQWGTLFYNNNWQPGAPTRMERGICHTAEMMEKQTWVAMIRDTPAEDFLPPRWSTTVSQKRPGSVGYLGGTYLFGSIIVAVHPRS